MTPQWTCHPHPLYFAGSISLALLTAAVGISLHLVPDQELVAWILTAVGGALALRPAYRIFSATYLMTDSTLAERRGLIARRTSEIELRDVRSIQVQQSLIERALGLGDVLVSTAGQAGVEVVLKGIRRPALVAEQVRAARATTGPPTE